MQLLTNLKTIVRKEKGNFALAEQAAAKEREQLKFLRGMLPAAIEEKTDHIRIDNGEYLIKNIIIGVQKGMRPGLPPQLRDNFLSDISNIHSKDATISYTVTVFPNKTEKALREVNEAITSMNETLHKTKETSPSLYDISTNRDREDVIQQGEKLHYGERQLSMGIIITIRARSMESLQSIETIIKQKLSDHDVGYQLALCESMAAYRATLPIPTRASTMEVEMFPDYASNLTPLSAANCLCAETGVMVGVDTRTGKQIIVDPNITLHSTVIGATGAGKTVFLITTGLREYTTLGMRFIYLSPKKETKTDFINVAEELGVNASIVEIGRNSPYNINPLQIMKRGKRRDKYDFSNHLSALCRFFNTLTRGSITWNMDNEIVMTVKDLYAQRGIYKDDPSTWDNADWPTLLDLHNYWTELSQKDSKNKSLSALANKTAMAGEMWDYLNRPTNIEFKDVMMFDLSGCDSTIKDAMYVHVTGMLMELFKQDDDGVLTNITLDEVGHMFKIESVRNFILDILRLGRSARLRGRFGSQSCADFMIDKEIDAQIKANISAHYIFGKNMRPDNVKTTQDYFSFSDEQVKKSIIGVQPGECLAIIDNITVPFRNVLSDWERKVILESERTQKTGKKTESGAILKPAFGVLAGLVKQHGIIFNSWTDESHVTMQNLGFVARNAPHCIGQGMHKIWIRKDLIDCNDMVGNQSKEHKASVIEISAYLLLNGYPAEVSDYNGVDVSTVIAGKSVAIEFELTRKTRIELSTKYQNALHGTEKNPKKHDEVYFVSTSATEKYVSEAVGLANSISRGTAFEEFLTHKLSLK